MSVEPKSKRVKLKNKKKNWNKFDQTNIDEALDADRFNERAFGGDLADQKNEDLFVIDRGGKKKTPTKRKTNIERLLENKSKVAPPMPVKTQPMAKKAKREMEKRQMKKDKTIELRRKAAEKNKITVAQYEAKRTGLTNNYDLWSAAPANIPTHQGADSETAKKFNPADHAKEIDGRAGAKRPMQMKYKPDWSIGKQAVVPSHGGSSYNPDYDAHQALLREENNIEVSKTLYQQKIRKIAAPPKREDRVTEEDIFKESVQGLGIIEESDYETEDESEEPKPIKKPIRAEDRKDRKDRKKERRQVLQVLRAKRRKKVRILMNQIYQVKKFKRELREEEANLLERRKLRQEKLAKRMPRLGNAKWVKPEQDLKLTEELTGTLRELVPEGNVLSDRYNSFVERAMIEHRVKVNKHKRKFKVKYQQKRSFREFDEKLEKEIIADEKAALKAKK